VIKRILTAAALVFVVMLAIKDGRTFRVAGLTGSCTVVQTAADGSQLETCRPGRLEGRPNLSDHGCTPAGTSGAKEYWRCPAPVAASDVGR
jgi:hypothetical protein